MKTIMIKRTLLGAAISLAAMGASAADIFLTPSSPTVNIGDTLTLTVEGENFLEKTIGGSVTVIWDPTALRLDSTVSDLQASGTTNGWGQLGVDDIQIFADRLNFTGVNFFGSTGPSFDFFSMNFTALPPPSVSMVEIGLGVLGDWQSGSFSPILDVNYTGASVTVNEVPLPAAVWLFGTGLLGLAGIARRRNQAEAATA
jgi:hypothetical protein